MCNVASFMLVDFNYTRLKQEETRDIKNDNNTINVIPLAINRHSDESKLENFKQP